MCVILQPCSLLCFALERININLSFQNTIGAIQEKRHSYCHNTLILSRKIILWSHIFPRVSVPAPDVSEVCVSDGSIHSALESVDVCVSERSSWSPWVLQLLWESSITVQSALACPVRYKGIRTLRGWSFSLLTPILDSLVHNRANVTVAHQHHLLRTDWGCLLALLLFQSDWSHSDWWIRT